jgi:hypothetical protein
MPKPTPDDIPLFIRHDGEVYAYGGLRLSHKMSPLGISTPTSDYDYVVSATDPRATHTTIEGAILQAITDTLDGARILVLKGTYAPTTPMAGTTAYFWNGITLTIEGEGWGTRITTAPGATTAFGVGSTSATSTAKQGNGSRIIGLAIEGYAQAVRFESAGQGIRNCLVDVWAGAHTTYTSPSISGGGTSENNDVTVRVYANTDGTLAPNVDDQVRRYLLGTNSLLVYPTDNAFTMLKTGNTSVVSSGKRRITNSYNSSITPIGSGAGTGYLVATDSSGRLASLGYSYDDDAGSIVLRDTNGNIKGSRLTATDKLFVFGSSTTTSNSGDALVQPSGGEVKLLAYATTDTAHSLVKRDGNGFFATKNLQLTNLSAIGSPTAALVIDGSGNVGTGSVSSPSAEYLISYKPGSNLVYWGWTGGALVAKVDATEEVPLKSSLYYGTGTNDSVALKVEHNNVAHSNLSFKYTTDVSVINANCDEGTFPFITVHPYTITTTTNELTFKLNGTKEFGLQVDRVENGWPADCNDPDPAPVTETLTITSGSSAWTFNTSGSPKTFVIDHPDKEDSYLVHATIEGPTVDVFYRGQARLTKGICTIALPPYFESLTKKENRTIQLTCIDGWSKIWAEKVEEGKFTVRGEAPRQEFHWEVKAERKVDMDVEPTKEKSNLYGSGPYLYLR